MTVVIHNKPKQHSKYIEASVELDISFPDKILLECYDITVDSGGTFNNIFIPQNLHKIKDHGVISVCIPVGDVCWSTDECSPYDLAVQEWYTTIETRVEEALEKYRERYRCIDVECDIPVGELTTWTVEYLVDANGSIIGDSLQTVVEGQSTTPVTAQGDFGFSFVSWDDGNTNATRTDGPITEDLTFTATFDVSVYTLTYESTAGGSVSGDLVQTVTHGDDGTPVTATPDSGFLFVAWSDGVTTSTRTETNVTASATYTAVFEEDLGPNHVLYGAALRESIIDPVTGNPTDPIDLSTIDNDPSLMDNLSIFTPIVYDTYVEFETTSVPAGQVDKCVMIAIPEGRGNFSDFQVEDPPQSDTLNNDFALIEYNGYNYRCYRIQANSTSIRKFRYMVEAN